MGKTARSPRTHRHTDTTVYLCFDISTPTHAVTCIHAGMSMYNIYACLLACLRTCVRACLLGFLSVRQKMIKKCVFVSLLVCLLACLLAWLFVCSSKNDKKCVFVSLLVCLLACLLICLHACLFVFVEPGREVGKSCSLSSGP